VAFDDDYSTSEDTTLTVEIPGVLGNDNDTEGDPLTAILQAGPSNGSLTINANGSFTYTPDANFNGTDTFTYLANDGTDDSNIATVTITVDPVLDAALHYVGTTLTNGGVFVPLRVTAEPLPDDGEVVAWSGYTVTFTEGLVDLCGDDTDRVVHEAVKPLFIGDASDIGTAHCLYDGFSGDRNGDPHLVTAQLVDPNGLVIATLDVEILVFGGIQQIATGGGNLELFESGGLYPADRGSKKNYGFKLDSGKGNKDPSGDINIVYDYTVGGEPRLYQIKAQTIVSAATKVDANTHPVAEGTGAGNLIDITDSGNPLVLATDLLVQVEATDNAPDSVAYSVWDATGYLIFATNWAVYQPVEQELSGGNIDIK